MKNVVIVILLFIFSLNFAQDANFWSFRFKFKINTEETLRYQYKNAEFFVNDSYSYESLRSSELTFDEKTKEYLLSLNYSCISCGYRNADMPPEIYIKINFDYPHFGTSFSSIIPVYFHKSESFRTDDGSESEVVINLGMIKVQHFITDHYWKDTIETYEIIDVKSVDSVSYKKAGEYIPRRMNRLIPVL